MMEKKKRREKSTYTEEAAAAAVSIPDRPLPLFIRNGPRARRGIYFMAFCFVQGTVGHFSSAAPAPAATP